MVTDTRPYIYRTELTKGKTNDEGSYLDSCKIQRNIVIIINYDLKQH